MVEAIVVVLPKVLVGVDMVLIHVVAHVGVCEDVLELGVVVIGNLSERIEKVWVDWARLDHVVPLLFLGGIGS